MNRAFVNEDSDSGIVFVPPRAPLPAGMINYVTPRGYRLLEEELAELEEEKTRVQNSRKMADQEKVRLLTIARGRHADLKARISGAKVVRALAQPGDEVRFGAGVLLRAVSKTDNTQRRITIVGVDEANASEGRVSFIAPIARALIGKHKGESLLLPSSSEPLEFKIIEITYESVQV